MKCILFKKDETIHRLPDDEAKYLVQNELARYVPKSKWKAAGRPR